jgi:preprotein translocase subunit SecD
LTLPGIAGLILTVGMAVDANVLIFERIREELDKGKTARAAIDSGYSRALTTILDANVTTIFAAIILMQFGSGPVKGFAVTLFWGILSSLFTAIFVTRTFFNWRTERKVLKTISI